VFDRQRFEDEVRGSAPGILSSRAVSGPPAGPFESGAAYPLAVDVDGELGAVSHAALDPYPDIAEGWWCVAHSFSFRDGGWCAASDHDNTTSSRPFVRPSTVENGKTSWMDWASNGGIGEWEEEPRMRHLLFGIAPTTTARLVLATDGGRRRDLDITPWCGAYVAIVAGAYSELTGYGPSGETLGSCVCQDGAGERVDPAPPPPGWERVEGLGTGLVEPEVWRKVD
jgi:hypothetical protein